MKQNVTKHAGFTLIELLVVIAIISILAVIGIPSYVGQKKRAARLEAFTNLGNLRLLQEQYFAENGEYAPSAGNAGADQPGNIALIRNQLVLPGFKPGDVTSLSFSYEIRKNASMTSQTADSTTTPCFLAIASANTNSRVAGDPAYMVDCNNETNY